ncbi:exodeoxyribonuclease VII small subunit [Alteromonas sp. ASW11-36]|uniref:Exodeoxyribonuclease 7 small subunit n=1 Tax=Alteromonas arenosi TaxID=3055817 RepID=A0ABT7SUB0_9ALTE|nr:exodeoxyribonuclease VII small subunit [Alteromonas sp. ASW11-36]MDM7859783.1 exodeoxyribonuclease VII small subunit [Alteromonas sp. ASW11-36]
MSQKASDSANFEKTLEELEEIVSAMENGDLPLQDALEKFERGVQLTKHGQALLQAAEQKVQILTNKDGQTQLEDMAPDDD